MTPLLVDLASWWLQAGLLLGAGLVLPGLVRLRDPGIRLRLGQLLLAIAILLPLLQPRAASQADGIPGTGPVFSLAILVTGKPPVAAASVETAVLVLLATGAALRLAWLGAGLVRLRSLRRRSRPLAPLPPSIASASERIGATAEILVSPEVASPVTLGWLRPAVLLPASFLLLEETEQEAVACHELLHVKRRDSWALLLEEGARALLWAQPAAWGVLSGISLSREQAVDRAAVDSTGDLRAYLRALAVLARLSQESPAAALPFHTRSHLVRRVAHLAKEVPMSRTLTSLATVVAAASLFLVGAAGAAAFPFGDDFQPPAAKAAPAKAGSAAANDGDALEVGGDVKEPVVTSRVQPTYPEEARKSRIQGIVKISAVIDPKGTVTKVEPIESPDPTLAAAAVDAVKKWTYKPATLRGKPVKVRMIITVAFKLA